MIRKRTIVQLIQERLYIPSKPFTTTPYLATENYHIDAQRSR
jgi:hypothetical protein